MASDQTLPLPVLPAPSNPDRMPTPDRTNREPDPALRGAQAPRQAPLPAAAVLALLLPASSDPLKQQHHQPPFKFQRIWSESDELRFLQGLLGCGAQGLVFPRDLNVFYDRFSESMPQPYTRSQLSEKLRRLKNKFRNVSARVARGLDPARLAPHDRDVLHLCSRLWNPANAATSPFAANAGTSGNKRRSANPRGGAAAPLALPVPSGDSNSHDYNGTSSGTPGAFPDGNSEDMMYLEQESAHLYDIEGATLVADGILDGITKGQPETVASLPNIGDNGVGNENGNCKVVVPCSNEHRMANSVLDLFEKCLREAKANGSTEHSELANRWRVQRIDELDALSRRLRLLIEDAAAAGN